MPCRGHPAVRFGLEITPTSHQQCTGFFVPTDGVVGDRTIINGKLSLDTLSVSLLKHYAEDAGKPTEEINKIKDPEISMTFLAEGVMIKEK